ncbi:MAG: efflux RND transporter periplasmic adaptor subunit [Chloroflexi bacterium]|nr:efflux RND transporter periplasmic adaptor subunit [Chloroflexota bacterium]
MNTRNIVIGIVILVILGFGFFTVGGGQSMLNPKPTPAPVVTTTDYENIVTASGTLVPVKRANLGFKIGGEVKRIAVQTGDTVDQDAMLVQLDAVELNAGVDQAKAAVALAQAGLDQLKAGASKEDIAAAEAALNTARTQLAKVRAGATAEDIAAAKATLDRATSALKDAQSEYDKIKSDPAAGMYPQSIAYQAATEQYRIAEARYLQVVKGATPEDIRIAEAGVATAQANLDRVKAQARPAEIAAAQARLDQAQAALRQAQSAAASANLTAPFAGTVAAVNVRVGEMVVPGVTVITLGDIKNLRLETDDLSETNIAKVKLGQSVDVTFEALPGKIHKGKITFIAPISSAKAGGTNYTVYVEFDQLDPVLRWGMTGHIEINTKQ